VNYVYLIKEGEITLSKVFPKAESEKLEFA